jgi:hypothetical protein
MQVMGGASRRQVPAASAMPQFVMYASHCVQKVARLERHEPQPRVSIRPCRNRGGVQRAAIAIESHANVYG